MNDSPWCRHRKTSAMRRPTFVVAVLLLGCGTAERPDGDPGLDAANSPYVVGLAADLTDAYVTDGATLWRVPLSGAAPTAPWADADVSSVSVDDSGVYATTANEVLRIDPRSAAAAVVAKGQHGPHAVATDALFVYWLNARNEVLKVAM